MLDREVDRWNNVRPEIRRVLRQLSELGEEEILLDTPCRQPAARAFDLTVLDGRPAVAVGGPPAASVSEEWTSPQRALLLADMRESCRECGLCSLSTGRIQAVFGVGNPEAHLMFVGEAPGADEDRQGEPFVGKAGMLLTKIIEAMQMKREDVYIANVIKCRPPGNRTPSGEEVSRCIPYLRRQIEIIGPKVLCALGRVAAQALLGTQESLAKIRGRVYLCGNSRLVVTYHPAALLRDPSLKRVTWEDMKVVRKELDGVEL